MPSLKKKVLSLYLRTGCQRQLALNLYGDKERSEMGMPPRQTARAGLGLVGKAGYEWQDTKVSELASVFSKARVYVNSKEEGGRPGMLNLADVLKLVKPYDFIIEGKYKAQTEAFCDGVGIGEIRDRKGNKLEVGDANPDIIQVLSPMRERPTWEGGQGGERANALTMEVLPTGDIQPLDVRDARLRLRVIDIKQSAEPGAHYFAEVVYYSITLAAWLVQNEGSNKFVVVAAPAVWPGSYEASSIAIAKELARKQAREATCEELAQALEDDIEVAPFDVFAPRLRRFFQEELAFALQAPWDELPWHVSYSCNGCEFLGYPWLDNKGELTNHHLHCWPTAERENHLSRVAGLSQGGAKLISDIARDVGTLAEVVTDDPIFDRSPTLRSKRTIYPHRARALSDKIATVVPASGGDALMPRWPDLHIYIFLDFDLASAITAAFSLRAFWKEALPFTSQEKPKIKRWAAFENDKFTGYQEVFLVDQRNLERERQELISFLRALRAILEEVRTLDDQDVGIGRRGDARKPEKAKRSTYQIYLWDEAQRKHLVRVIGRHLGAILADSRLRDLAWLFPPPELLAHAEDASFNSPFTVVANVVQNTVAVPVPHHYTLLEAVQTYRPDVVRAPTVHPLYREPLSDLVPGERLHEMWMHRGDWLQTMNTVRETTQKKLSALAYIVGRLERDLKDVLNRAAAPPLVRAPKRITGVAPHCQLWHEFTRLNAALEELDSHTIRAMPAHEREARFKSAHLLKRLEGKERTTAIERLQAMAGRPLSFSETLVIYNLAPGSRDVNIRPPALGYALAPKDSPGFLDRSVFPLVKDVPNHLFKGGRKPDTRGSVADAGLTNVSVIAIDRFKGIVALQPSNGYQVAALEQAGMVNLSANVMLDPISSDYLTKKVRLTLEGIGRPASAVADESVLRALGVDPPNGTPTPEMPASEFLWQASTLSAAKVSRDLTAARTALEREGVRLNTSQWAAWEAALTRRLALVWGPPGTGKTETLRAVIGGAVWVAHAARTPLRILVSAGTYAASDNVLVDTAGLLARLLPSKPYQLVRLQRSYDTPSGDITGSEDGDIKLVVVKPKEAGPEVIGLQNLLKGDTPQILILAGPPQQLHNLAIATKSKTKNETAKRTQRRWFDLIIIDEASQLDVAQATLIVTKAADGAAFVLAGDDKQLPPIHQATAPEKLDHVVGSVYGYVRHHHGVVPTSLQVNYRSNDTLVELTKRAGYDPKLQAQHANLRLKTLGDGFPKQRPDNWPSNVVWSPEWTRLLAPDKPAACFLYQDDVASQANDFEAEVVAALTWLLYGRIDRQLAGEYDKELRPRPLTGEPLSEREFWERGVGIVTPHRAQMAKIVERLQRAFPSHDPAFIWGAVDTVERFQGQQRDVIIASFGLGDPDLIRAEDEFLYQLNRFNVMTSRARAKLIVLVTRTLVEYLSDNVEVLDQSRLLKYFVETFCINPEQVTLAYMNEGKVIERVGFLRTR